MNKLLVTLCSSCFMLAAGHALAADDATKRSMDKPAVSQDDTGKNAMGKEGTKKKKHRKAKAKKSQMKKDDMNK